MYNAKAMNAYAETKQHLTTRRKYVQKHAVLKMHTHNGSLNSSSIWALNHALFLYCACVYVLVAVI